MRVFVFILACFVFPLVTLARRGDTLVHATLICDASEIAPGQIFHVGVLLKIEPSWHIYWKYPGDSGLATTVKLQMPAGFTSGPVEYPFPTRLELPGNIVNYIYENETMLVIPVTAPKDLTVGTPISISAKINWLVCTDICLPGSATVELVLPVATNAVAGNTAIFQQWMARVPLAHDPENIADVSIEFSLNPAVTGRSGPAAITIQWRTLPTDIQWFPAPPSGAMLSNINISTLGNTTAISFHVDVSSDTRNNPGIQSVLEYTIAGGRRMALAIPGRGN